MSPAAALQELMHVMLQQQRLAPKDVLEIIDFLIEDLRALSKSKLDCNFSVETKIMQSPWLHARR